MGEFDMRPEFTHFRPSFKKVLPVKAACAVLYAVARGKDPPVEWLSAPRHRDFFPSYGERFRGLGSRLRWLGGSLCGFPRAPDSEYYTGKRATDKLITDIDQKETEISSFEDHCWDVGRHHKAKP